jgi:hypothetical protein
VTPGVVAATASQFTLKTITSVTSCENFAPRLICTCRFQAATEKLLREASGRDDYRLADYFDYIAGTSTGGIIAAGLAIGMSVDEILNFYEQSGAEMFEKAKLVHRLKYQYQSEPSAKQLKGVFGAETTLGSDKIETLLLLVMRNATTDSPWPVSNNPFAKYNDPAHVACNLKFPLWQLVRRAQPRRSISLRRSSWSRDGSSSSWMAG